MGKVSEMRVFKAKDYKEDSEGALWDLCDKKEYSNNTFFF